MLARVVFFLKQDDSVMQLFFIFETTTPNCNIYYGWLLYVIVFIGFFVCSVLSGLSDVIWCYLMSSMLSVEGVGGMGGGSGPSEILLFVYKEVSIKRCFE